LLSMAEKAFGDGAPVTIAAVGGYGRGDLSPHSDIDLLIVGNGRAELNKAALREMLYPLWDAGFQVGHAVTTPKGAIERTEGDVHAATSLLTVRYVAGDREVFEDLMERRTRWMTKNRKTLVRRIVGAVRQRHEVVDRAGWSLAPDIKEDVGGLRDVHSLLWLATVTGEGDGPQKIREHESLLLAVREALHAELKRKSDKMRADLQPAVAKRLGLTGEDAADLLMAQVHAAARKIEFQTDLGLEHSSESALGGPRRSGSSGSVGQGVRLQDGVLVPVPNGEPAERVALRLIAAHSSSGRPLAARSLDMLLDAFGTPGETSWDQETREEFMKILRGPHAVGALELLENSGAWRKLMPEWNQVRGRIQHDPWHRFTVDGHSFIAVREIDRVVAEDPLARAAADDAGDINALYLGTLLHDVGKGSGRDHSIAGEETARRVAARMGLDEAMTEEVAMLVRHHLLLPDTATRRDLDDGAVIGAVADRVGSARKLRLLYVLACADGRATGPESWTSWKAALVAELYTKVLAALELGSLPERSDVAARVRELTAYEPLIASQAAELLDSMPPSYLHSTGTPEMADELRLLLRPVGPARVNCHILPEGENQAVVTICLRDRPGTLARAAGVMALHRLSVLRAQAFSSTTGLALQRFTVETLGPTDWTAVEKDFEAAFSGRLAIESRLQRKAGDYKPSTPLDPEIRVLQDESTHSTVVEVRAGDALGLLFAITAGLSDLEADIHVAKIDTRGSHVVDVFYVRSPEGEKLDERQAGEVRRAIEHRIQRLFD
jgi:[protein-PII] uridylyltransferase